MKTLDQRSPYFAKRNRAFKNLFRAKRACDTLSGDYCAGRITWERYSYALDVCQDIRESLDMLDARNSAWISDQIAYL